MMHFVRFLHLPIWGYTAVLPIFGAISVTEAQTRTQLLSLLAVATAFHNYAYVLNDLIDLPIDRTQSLRKHYPLVCGAISEKTAIIFVLLNLVTAYFIASFITRDLVAFACLTMAFVLMSIYNFWGKRFSVPPFTDFIQGMGWGMLILFGATAVSSVVMPMTISIVLFIVVYILLVNGVNGALRDLENDQRHKAKTTPIWFGVRTLANQKRYLPKMFQMYAMCLQILLILVGLFLITHNPDYQLRNAYLLETKILFVVMVIAALAVSAFVLRSPQDANKVFPWLMTSNICMLLMLFILLLPTTNVFTFGVVLFVFIAPLLLADWVATFWQDQILLSKQRDV